MQTPTEFELQHLFSNVAYDPVKAHEYYEKHKKLKGRRTGQAAEQTTLARAKASADPRKGKTKKQIHQNARTRQRQELSKQILGMQERLSKLEALIKKRSHEEASEDRKGKAKKERAAKENEKPKSAAEKAKAARESKKDRSKHQQELKTKAKKKDSKSGGSKKDGKKSGKHTVSELKVRVQAVKGQIAAAKQKLAAL
jgi:hypothetical protein